MTDRYNYLTVALERDIRDEDAAALIAAISMLRGVLKIEPNVVDGSDWTAQMRVRQEMSNKLWEVIYPKAQP